MFNPIGDITGLISKQIEVLDYSSHGLQHVKTIVDEMGNLHLFTDTRFFMSLSTKAQMFSF
jgi:hypothetical protein